MFIRFTIELQLQGNTVLHYAISHGNISVVESLLSIEELDVDRTNQAGYTSAMLAALCDVTSDNEQRVFKELFSVIMRRFETIFCVFCNSYGDGMRHGYDRLID